jgi:hypothetical protein
MTDDRNQTRGGGPSKEGDNQVLCPGHQRLQAPSDIAGSGGDPRLATAWETEARSVLIFFARSVNTEGPRPLAAEQGRRERPGARGRRCRS